MDINIPEYIYHLVDYEFCTNIIKELHIIFGISLETFQEDTFIFLEGSIGWETALISACRKCSKGMVYQFYKNLDWYESDKFNGWLSDRMAEMNLILKGSEKSAVAEFSNHEEHDIEFCLEDSCYYKINEHNTNENKYKIKNDSIKEKVIYDIKAIIENKLGLKNDSYFICNKCHRIFWNIVKNKDICMHCSMENDLTVYIQEEMQKNDDFKHYLRI